MKPIKILLLLVLALASISFTYPQETGEPIEYTRDAYVDEINRLDSIIQLQEEQILVLQNIVNSGSAFCEGWEDGYKEGYCYRIMGCIDPIPPICPIPDIGENSYKDGYNRGFSKGRADQ